MQSTAARGLVGHGEVMAHAGKRALDTHLGVRVREVELGVGVTARDLCIGDGHWVRRIGLPFVVGDRKRALATSHAPVGKRDAIHHSAALNGHVRVAAGPLVHLSSHVCESQSRDNA